MNILSDEIRAMNIGDQYDENYQFQALVGQDFESMTFGQFKGKYLVFFFYPLDFTFVCPTEIIEFNDRLSEFQALNCQVIGCSTDSLFSHLAWNQKDRTKGGLGGCQLPLVSDFNKELAEIFGVLVQDGNDRGVTYRGLFIFDGEGKCRHLSINDLPVGRNVDEVLRLVKAFQFTDKHGEVCPIGWTPEKASMKPDPVGSQSYFQETFGQN